MFEKDLLFYMANFDPEINRMDKAYRENNKEKFVLFKNKSLLVLNKIIESKELKGAGKEEWFTIRNIVEGYEHATPYMQKITCSFGLPFSEKFARRLTSLTM